jgi:hypothetical protein
MDRPGRLKQDAAGIAAYARDFAREHKCVEVGASADLVVD